MKRNLIAILRGIKPSEAVEISQAVIQAGFTTLEITLDSPRPFESLKEVLQAFDGQNIEIGAGTVLKPSDVDKVAALGGQLIVSPNFDAEVIKATIAAGLQSWPGVQNASLAQQTLEIWQEASFSKGGLKCFPAGDIGVVGVRQISDVVPIGTPIYPVGGVDASNMHIFWAHGGATGFGMGSALYKAGMGAEEVAENANSIISAYDALGRA